MDDVHRQPRGHRSAQGLSTDYIAAMNDCLGASFLGGLHCFRQRIGTVVAVGNDADPHGPMVRRIAAFVGPPALRQCKASPEDQAQSWHWSRPGHLPCLRARQPLRSRPIPSSHAMKEGDPWSITIGVAQPG